MLIMFLKDLTIVTGISRAVAYFNISLSVLVFLFFLFLFVFVFCFVFSIVVCFKLNFCFLKF